MPVHHSNPRSSAERQKRTSPAIGPVLVLLFTIGVGSSAALADAVSYVLEPQAMSPITKMLDRMQPALRYSGVAIDRDVVTTRLCPVAPAQGECFVLRLEHPSTDCPDSQWGQFCARFPGGRPDAAVTAVIARTLSEPVDTGIWKALVPPTPAPTVPPASTTVAAQSGAGPRGTPEADAVGTARTLAVSFALTVAPFAAGWLVGWLWRRQRRQRWGGHLFATAAIVIPAVCAVWLDAYWELIGVWDALCVSMAASAGLLLAVHRACADWRNVLVMVGACVVGLIALELASRAFLPPPPAFPTSQGPTLFLSDMMRFTPARAFSTTAAGILTCYALYGGDSPTSGGWDSAYPATWRPRADARARVLHLGDSMVYGSPWNGRFTDNLNRMEPDVEHVNAAIAGTAPDVYLSLARLFIAQHDFDAVVMHLTPNDYGGIDDCQYPCSEWKSLLVYEPSGTRLRFPIGHPQYANKSRLAWLMQNSPPPYILRASVGVSSLAAHLSAAVVYMGRRLGYMPADVGDSVRDAHLTAILRDARDELGAGHIPLVVDIFRDRGAVEAGKPPADWAEDKMKGMAEDLGIVTLDTWEPLRAAVQRGEDVYASPTDPHFSAAGHARVAEWLHAVLPGAIEKARERNGHPPAENP
jgi:hypothetical protein